MIFPVNPEGVPEPFFNLIFARQRKNQERA